MSEIMKNTSVVPDGWSIVSLGDVLQYEQPYYYTVTSDDYNDIAGTPVLTAGKSFLLGYTTEVENVYNNLPVIIFDDFTTDSKFVDFPFKVKSSAMKFLKPKEENVIDLRLIFEFIQKLKISVANADHKRRWISEFSKIKILIPSYPEQQHIAKILSTADSVIEKTQAAIAKYKAIKQGMLQDLFTRGIDLNTNKLRPRFEDAPELYKESKLGLIPREWEEKIVDDIAKVNGRVGWKGYTVADLRDFGPLALGATHIDKENKLDLSNPIHLSMEKYIESPEIIVQFGDLLIVQRGTIGKIVVIDRQIGEATINPSMVLLNNIKINNFFLYYQLCSFIGQLQIELLTTQTGVPMISQEQIKNINLIIPKNPKETDAIAERLKNIDTILDNEKSYLQKMQSLKKGLMEDLLSGKKQVKVAEEVLTQSEN